MSDPILKKLAEIEWLWADEDESALQALEDRIAQTGKHEDLINYSDLVRGVKFQIPTINGGKPYEIHVHNWIDLDRALIGDFLGKVCARSYERGRFMASALVVNKGEAEPSWHFFQWMQTLDVLPDLSKDTVLKFWSEQVSAAHKWFQSH